MKSSVNAFTRSIIVPAGLSNEPIGSYYGKNIFVRYNSTINTTCVTSIGLPKTL